MTLPLLVSVPHAGLDVPPEARAFCALGEPEIARDGDEGARQIYAVLEPAVAAFVTTAIARAVVDLNRAEDDRRADGAIKTHTCFEVPVWCKLPPAELVATLIDRYWRPYHARLTELARSGVRLGVDCHTMLAVGPPIGPGPGIERPRVCLSNAEGTCPAEWLEGLAGCFARAFETEVAINHPFRGGYVIRRHAAELPWVQLELSRAPFLTAAEKGRRVLAALDEWCAGTG